MCVPFSSIIQCFFSYFLTVQINDFDVNRLNNSIFQQQHQSYYGSIWAHVQWGDEWWQRKKKQKNKRLNSLNHRIITSNFYWMIEHWHLFLHYSTNFHGSSGMRSKTQQIYLKCVKTNNSFIFENRAQKSNKFSCAAAAVIIHTLWNFEY